MTADGDPDVRGRRVVWQSGAGRPSSTVVRRRHRLFVAATVAMVVAAAGALVTAVGVSVLPDPQNPQPETGLWQAGRTTPVESAAPTASPTDEDDHGGNNPRGSGGG